MDSILRFTRRVRRLLLIGLHLVWGGVLALTVLRGDPGRRRPREWSIIMRWMARLCRILGLRIHVSGERVDDPVLLLANHTTWQDIPVLQSRVPTGFVAKFEIRGWPLIGWLAHRGNTLFIRRGHRDSVQRITRAMSERMQAGQNILVFPEGTTTDGERVARFHSRLLSPAIELQRGIQPVAICHQSPGRSCKELAFIGDETFVHHWLRVMGEPYIDVHVHFCTPIPVTPSTDRRELAAQAQQAVAAALKDLKLHHREHRG